MGSGPDEAPGGGGGGGRKGEEGEDETAVITPLPVALLLQPLLSEPLLGFVQGRFQGPSGRPKSYLGPVGTQAVHAH